VERRVAVIRSNRVDGPALACFVAVPFEGTLELSRLSSQLLKRIWTFASLWSSEIILYFKVTNHGSARLGGMRLPRYL